MRPPGAAPRWMGTAAAVAGPALIVAAVLVVLHRLAFGGMMSDQHPDLLPYWLPTYCFLGEGLAGGHVPDWNPHVMAGVPFAADPQSGWMHLPAMLVSSVFPCGTSLQWLIVVQPIIAGLGLYWFLRGEALSRPAATAGGASLALGMAASVLAISMPLAGAVAWTALLLAAASRSLRADRWPARLGWAAATAVAWGQVAVAHLSHGLVMATGALVAYGAARAVSDVRAGRRTAGQAMGLAGVLVLALPLVNLAILLPRLAYLPETSLGLGYEGLRQAAARVAGAAAPGARVSVDVAIGPAWPLGLATAPGAYLGAAILGLSFAGWWCRRYRYLVIGLGVFGLLAYVAALERFAEAILPFASSVPFGDFYVKAPLRFALALFIAVPVLGAVGLEAWRERSGAAARIAMVVPGVLVWGVATLVLVEEAWAMLLPAAAFAATAALLAGAAARPRLLGVVPMLLAVELVANGLWGQSIGSEVRFTALYGDRPRPLTNLLRPAVDTAAYTRAGPIAAAMAGAPGDGRYVSLVEGPLQRRGTLRLQDPEHWPLLHNQRSVLFGLESVEGYNPVQLLRFWLFLRTALPEARIRYNRATVAHPDAAFLDLVQVRWVVGPADRPPLDGLIRVVDDGGWALYRRPGAPPRASAVGAWTVAHGPARALQEVTGPGFEPGRRVVLEAAPDVKPDRRARAGTVRYEAVRPDSARIDVRSQGPALVLVRNAYHEKWRAWVDGRPAPVLAADYLFQAVPVPPGSHSIRLTYDDPWIGYGLAGSGAALAALLAPAVATAVQDRRRRRRERRDLVEPSPVGSGSPSGSA